MSHSDVSTFLDNASNMQRITKEVNSTDGFNELCILLEIPMGEIMSLKRHNDAVYMAFRRWTRSIRTMNQLSTVLYRFSPRLANDLGLARYASDSESARDFLDRTFRDGVGATLLLNSACRLVNAFESAFRFVPSETADAHACSSNTMGYTRLLLEKWLRKNPSKTDLYYCLKRWGNLELIEQLAYPQTSQASQHESASCIINTAVPAVTTPLAIEVRESSKNASGRSIVSAFNKITAKRDITCRDFFTQTDGIHANTARDLIAALDQTSFWEMILANMGLLSDVGVAAEVVSWKKAWQDDEISPTRRMLDELLTTPWADTPMKEFAIDLINNAPVSIQAIMQTWISKIDGKEQKAIVEGVKRFQTAKTLNSFFIELIQDGVFTKVTSLLLLLAYKMNASRQSPFFVDLLNKN